MELATELNVFHNNWIKHLEPSTQYFRPFKSFTKYDLPMKFSSLKFPGCDAAFMVLWVDRLFSNYSSSPNGL